MQYVAPSSSERAGYRVSALAGSHPGARMGSLNLPGLDDEVHDR